VIGGQKPGERGRGANGKSIVLAAVEKEGHKFGRIRLQVIPVCSGAVLEQFVSTNTAAGSTLATDGWKGYNFASENYIHRKTITSKTDDKSSVEFHGRSFHPCNACHPIKDGRNKAIPGKRQ
jgi:hypothetical protein